MRQGLLEFVLVAVPKVAGGAGTIIINLILLRYLGPEQFGIYSLCLAAIMLADGTFGAAFDTGVLRLAPLYRLSDPSRSYSIEKSALMLKLALTVSVLVLTSLCARPISHAVFHRADYPSAVILSSAAAVGLLMLRSVQVHLQVDRKFALYGAVDLLHNTLKLGGIALILGFGRPSPTNILALTALAPASVFLVTFATLRKKLLERSPGDRAAFRELLHFVTWSLITFGIASVASRLDLILLTGLATIREVGIFSAATTVTMITELLGAYLAVVLSPRIMPLLRAGKFFAFFKKSQSAFVAAALVMCIVGELGRFALQGYLFPAQYGRSGGVIAILLPGALAAMVNFPLVISFLMFVRPRFLVSLECATLPITVVLYVYAIRAQGAVGAAWVTSVTRLTKAVIAGLFAWNLARQSSDGAIDRSDGSPESQPGVLKSWD